MRLGFLPLCGLLFVPTGVRAQATWNFTAGAVAATLPANVTGGAVNATNGATPSIGATSVSSGYAGASAGNNASAAAASGAFSSTTSSYFEFTLTAAANYRLSATSFTLGSRSTSTGPTKLTLFSSADSFTTALGAVTVLADSNWALVTLPSFSVTGAAAGSLTFRLYASDGTSAVSGNWRLDDVSIAVSALPLPVIGTQPSAQSVLSGQTASFTVSATGTGSLSYQWRKGGTNIDTTSNPSAASSTLNLGTVTTVDSGGVYSVVVTDTVGSKTSSNAALTVSKVPTSLAFSNLTVTYDGNAHAATVTPTPSSGVTLSAISYTGTGGTTYGPSTTAPINAGSYTVSATITDSEHVASGSTTATLTINADTTATITLGALAQTYDGTQRVATATSSNPAGLATTITYTGSGATSYGPSTTPPINAGTYAVAAAFTSSNYGNSASGTLTVSPAAATITLSGLAASYNGSPRTVTATTNPAGLPVNLTYNGSSTPPTNAGTYPIVATIGATNYQGTDNTHSLVIAQLAQTITFGAITSSPAVGTPFTVSATASSGLTPVTFAIFSGNATATGATGSTITLNDSASVTIRATQAGDLNTASATADLTLSAGQLPQTITFAALPPRVTTEGLFFLNATASSGLTVTYTILSGPATLSSGVAVVLTGSAGTVVVRASQSGNAFYLPAAAVDRSFDITTPPAAPTITTQPTSQTANTGSAVDFTVVATGSPAPTYQWRKGGVAIFGATGPTLSLTNITPTDAGDYDVLVTNSGGSIASAVATLSVPVAPAITTQPANTTASAGGSATLTVVATGTPAPTYQWRKAGTAIAGATSATLTLSSLATTDAGSYDVVVTNALGSVTSNAATLTIGKVAQTITFTAPTTASPAGSSVKLNATASSGLAVSYSLVSGSGSISGGAVIGTSASVIVRASQAGNATYDPATPVDQTFTFFSGGVSPFLTASPADQTVAAGANVTLNASAIGTPAPTWQWQKDGTAIAGATNATLALPSVTFADAARYTVIATNPVGTATASATLTVRSAPAISAAPVSQTVFAGERVTFTITATGFPAPTYQWRKNGVAISGATTTSLTFASARTTDSANYDVVVTNSLGAVTSAAAQLTVKVHNFAGEYFGTFAGATGDFALHVRSDGTAAFIGYLPGLGTGLATLDVVVDSSGNFSLGAVTIAATPSDPRIAAAPRTVTLRGSLDESTGALTGSVAELGVTLGGTRAAASGTASAQAGFYQAALVGTAAARSYVVVGADGQAFFVAINGTAIDGAKTTLSATGHLTVTTAAQTNVDLGFNSGALTGTVGTSAGTATVAGAADGLAGTEHLVNLSVRAPTGPGAATLITGFVITGTTPKQVLIRAAGPAIAVAPFNVAGALADPVLQVFRGSTSVAQNDNWSGTALATAAASVGAFPFRTGSNDAALLTTLTPGAYTVQVSPSTSSGQAAGVTLAEIYEVLESAETAGTRRLANLSARGAVAPGAPLIAGFVITGTAPQRVLVRGIGPALAAAPFNIPGTLANPVLTLFRGSTAVKTNDDWFRDADAAVISSASAKVGAFALGTQSLDAAMLLFLEPGAYTAQVAGAAANASGNALVEIYEVP